MSHPDHQAPASIASPVRNPGGRSPEAPGGDPRAVRVSLARTSRQEGDPSFSLAPPADPALALADEAEPGDDPVLDGVPARLRLDLVDEAHARLVEAVGEGSKRTDVLFGVRRRDGARGSEIREVVVDGWRFEVEVEPERRAALRERARRSAATTGHGGPLEVRAIIPGRVAAVSVVAGDAIEAGQHILVIEAMKMQNELRAPRDGTIERLGVAVGDTIEVGDLLVVIN